MWVKVDYSTEAKKNPRPNMGGEWAIYTKKHWWNKWVERETYADVGWCIRDAKKLVEYPKQGERAIAWLEKQESEPNWCHHKVDLSNCSEEYRKAYYDGWNNCNMQHSQCESEKSDVLKCLINGMKFYYEDNEETTWGTEKFSMKVKDILSWLEKQGEYTNFCNKIQVGDKVTRNRDGVLVNLSQLKRVAKPSEEQGEQKPFDYENANIQQKDFAPKEDTPRYSIGDVLCDKSCTTLSKEAQSNFEITDIRNGMYICDKCSFPISQQDEYELVAKRIEQKPTDKVEPKFHEGEWITDGYDVLQISNVDIENQYYNCVNGNDGDINLTDKAYHLWTIQDAKDGDVLYFSDETIVIFKDLYNATTFHSYCHIEDGEFGISCEELPDWWEGKGFHPATKEQRDLLFQKMKEAGYEWDSEKKELKKVNSYCQENCKGFQETGKCFTDEDCKAKKEAEQKLVESEDEKIKKSLIHLVHLYYDGEFEMIDANTSVEKAIAWLEKQGKPSDEEMKILLRTEYEKGRADVIAEMQWSEEDSYYRSHIIQIIEEIKNAPLKRREDWDAYINWLKSLRPQNR